MAVTDNATAVIANGASVSGAVPCFDASHLAVVLPAAWTAAAITLQVAWTDAAPAAGDWRDLFLEGSEVSLAAAASRVCAMANTGGLVGAKWVRLRSGTSASPVTQGADRTIGLQWWRAN